MTPVRTMREERRYRRRLRNLGEGCPFCTIGEDHPYYVEETSSFQVVRNEFPYSIWDGQGVVDHLMILPKKHVDKLGDLNKAEMVEYMQVVQRYEAVGYNLYSRVPGSSVKTVVHLHSHLIKIDGRTRWFMLLLRRPFYLRLSW